VSRFAAGLKLRALSLHTKLMLAVTMLVALVVAGAAYLQIERERSRGLAELEARASALAALLSRSLAQPLWNVDVKAIDQQLGALSDNAEIAEIAWVWRSAARSWRPTAGACGPLRTSRTGPCFSSPCR
jgi:hypothetical protein